MKKIAVATASRSEFGLVKPIITRLNARNDVECVILEVEPYKFIQDYEQSLDFFKKHKPEVVVMLGDRREAEAISIAAFHSTVPVAHLHAGDKDTDTHDDINRFTISLRAHIYFCNGERSKKRVSELLKSVGIERENHIHNVGSTAFDDIELDDSLLPKEPFDLILYNPLEEKNLLEMPEELNKIKSMINKTTVIIGPNGDPGTEDIHKIIAEWKANLDFKITYQESGVTRSQFHAFMKKCDRFIGNSSCLIYEAPYYISKEKIVQVGLRNSGREPIDIKPGASDKIVAIICDTEDWK